MMPCSQETNSIISFKSDSLRPTAHRLNTKVSKRQHAIKLSFMIDGLCIGVAVVMVGNLCIFAVSLNVFN